MHPSLSEIAQPFHFLLIVLTAVAVHRLWMHEDIMRPAREWVQSRFPGLKPLLCSPCFAFWAGAASLLGSPLLLTDLGMTGYLLMSIYPPLRGVVGLYQRAEEQAIPHRRPARPHAKPSPRPPAQGRNGKASPSRARPVKAEAEKRPPRAVLTQEQYKALVLDPTAANCTTCKRNGMVMTKPPPHAADLPRVVHIAPFADFHAGYSLVQVLLDQCRASLRKGRFVCVLVNERFAADTIPKDLLQQENFMLKAILPVWVWQEDVVEEPMVSKLVTTIRHALMPLGRGTVFCHDLIFQASFLTHAKALHEIGDMKAFRFYHLCHSGPSPRRLEGDLRYRHSLPKGHRLLSLAYSHVTGLAAQYGVEPADVGVLPNPRDLTTLMGMAPEVETLVHVAHLRTVDVAQVLPVSLPRLGAKGIEGILRLYRAFRAAGRTCSLLILDAHPIGEASKDARQRAEALATELGVRDCLHFASDSFPHGDYHGGWPNVVAGGLLLHANLFVFPSRAECCPLVVMEAALAGNLLVLNLDLPVLHDLVRHEQALWAPFGDGRGPDRVDYPRLAEQVLEALEGSLPLAARRQVMREHSLVSMGDRLAALEQ